MNNLLISGICGRIGSDVAKFATDYGFNLIGGVDKSTNFYEKTPVYPDFSSVPILKKADVVIDFSSPVLATEALKFCEKNEVAFVCGTTALSEDFYNEAKLAAKKIPITISANFSASVQAFFKATKFLSELLPDFDKSIIEIHGKKKKDLPSGTALVLSENVKTNEIFSLRGGAVSGEHSALFLGDGEQIKITHTAFNKSVFAKGALLAAKNLLKQKVDVSAADL